MRKLTSELMHQIDHPKWTVADLVQLPQKELQFLCKLLGAPTSGTKAKLAERLMETRIIRKMLMNYPDPKLGHDVENREIVQRLVNVYSGKTLKRACRKLHLWQSGTKFQLAAGLLQWRARARQEGSQFYKECLNHAKTKPQLEFSF